MNTKLTLTMDNEVISLAKKVAADSGRSLSDLVENYLLTLIRLHKDKASSYAFNESDPQSLMVAEPESPVYSSRLQSLRGIAKDDGRDYKEQLGEIKKKKFLE